MIDPTRLPPWRQETFSLMEIQPGREMAVEKAEAVWSTSDIVQNKLPFRLCDQPISDILKASVFSVIPSIRPTSKFRDECSDPGD
jgi:hypothetical protein